MDMTYSLADIQEAANEFLDATKERKVFAFHGDLGSGKTTFIRALCNQLQVTNVVTSPTFSIINEYSTPGGRIIYHMDLYRIKDESEAVDAGVEECINSGNICFIEWPEKAPHILPPDIVHIVFSLEALNLRKLQIKL